MKNQRAIIIFSTVAFLLLIPFIAMQLTDEVNWNFVDFIVAAILLLGTGFGIDYIAMKVKLKKHRIALIVAAMLTLLLIWIELAVGIFGIVFSQ